MLDRGLHLALGLSAAHVLGRVKEGNVAAQDLFGGIPFDALRPFVPADDAPFGVEGKDRVIGYILHEKLELLLGNRRRPGGPLLLLHVLLARMLPPSHHPSSPSVIAMGRSARANRQHLRREHSHWQVGNNLTYL